MLTHPRRQPGRRLLLRVAVIPLLLALPSCGSETTIIEPDPEGLRVLFIGNSLTYANDLPGVLGWMLAQTDVAVGRIESVAFPNYGLEDHWGFSTARGRITEGNFDVVVLQQGPSATEGRPSLLEYSQLFAAEIVAAGGPSRHHGRGRSYSAPGGDRRERGGRALASVTQRKGPHGFSRAARER